MVPSWSAFDRLLGPVWDHKKPRADPTSNQIWVLFVDPLSPALGALQVQSYALVKTIVTFMGRHRVPKPIVSPLGQCKFGKRTLFATIGAG